MESTDATKKKRKRRRRGTGQVIERGENTFLVRVLKRRDSNGKRIFHSETVYGSKTDADNRCEDIRTQIRHGTFVAPSKISLNALLDKWLGTKQKNVREITLQVYKDIVDIYIRPEIGDILLSKLTAADVQDLYDRLYDRGLSRSTIQHVRSRLKEALAYAVTLDWLPKNPAANIKAPASTDNVEDDTKKKARAMNQKEAIAFLEATRENPDDLIFIFVLLTGLRPEEFIGLQWSQLELVTGFDPKRDGIVERGLARIRQTVVRRRGGGWYFSKPKSRKGRRDVYFPAALYHDLMEHRVRQDKHKRMMGGSYHDNDLVFASPNGEPLDRANLLVRRLRPLLLRAELPTDFTLYSLRYTYATLSLLAGESDKVISEQMGHARVNFTKDVYMDVLPVMQQVASDKLETLLFSGDYTQLAHNETSKVM